MRPRNIIALALRSPLFDSHNFDFLLSKNVHNVCKTHNLITSNTFSTQNDRLQKPSPSKDRPFIDKIKIFVNGGKGGNGCMSFRKSRHERHGKADGGNGGKGGDVILKANSKFKHLAGIMQHHSAMKGGFGTSKKKVGVRGENKIIYVPIGTCVYFIDGDFPSPPENNFGHKKNLDEKFSNLTIENRAHAFRHDFDSSQSQSQPHGMKSIEFDRMDRLEEEEDLDSVDRKCRNDFREGDREEKEGEEEEEEEKKEEGEGEDKDEEGVGDDEDEEVEGENEDEEVEGENEDEEGEGEEEEEEDEEVNRKKSNERILICELMEEGQSVTVAHGGSGGRGNAQLANDKLLTNLKPNLACTKSEPGNPGAFAILSLELKLLADIALIGFPNAGKSTLLNELTNAKPRIGNYAFTTTKPQLGMVEFDDYFCFTVADIPGLIEGAHLNRGLGIRFLRHIEKTKIFCFVIDLAPPRGGISPGQQVHKLFDELEQYDWKMKSRPFFIVANKIDEEEAEIGLDELRRELPKGVEVVPTCAVLGEGIPEVRDCMRRFVESYHP